MVRLDDNVEDILAVMDRHGVEHLAVIDPDEARRVVGMVSRADILAAHNRALMVHKEYNSSDHD